MVCRYCGREMTVANSGDVFVSSRVKSTTDIIGSFAVYECEVCEVTVRWELHKGVYSTTPWSKPEVENDER